MDIISKIKKILTTPEKFFSSLSKEKTIQDSLIYYILLLLFNVIMGYLVVIIFGDTYINYLYKLFNLNLPLPKISALSMIPQIILGYIFAVFGSFVVAGILYVWLLIFKGNKGYTKVYQLYTYSITPSLLLKWIPFIGIFGSIYSFVLLVIGTKKIYNFSTKKAVLIYLIPLIILLIIGIIFLALFFFAISKIGSLPQLY